MGRPEFMEGTTTRIKCGCGKLYLTMNSAENYQEVFVKLGKSGGCPAAFLDGIGRLITFALNAGVPMKAIIKAFSEIKCPTPMWDGNRQVFSCLDGISKLLGQESATNKSIETV